MSKKQASKKPVATPTQVTEIVFSIQEIQAIMNTIGQMPTQVGNGLYTYFINKINQANQAAVAKKEEVKTPDNVKPISSKQQKKGTVEAHG